MNLKAQRDLSIAGDVVGRDKITINITRGLDELPTRYDSRVQNFLEYYLGAKDHPAPFGGRASDLAALDAWLDDPAAPPYASLIAPAGRGKSALLAHWVTRLASRPANGAEAVHVVYFPISIRFNTNLETVVFASLAGRMAHVYGEKVTQATDAQQYRGVFSDYLRRTPPNGGRVLVMMDGLDEAASWEAGADLFPTVAPGHLRVIVAARPLALDKDDASWLNRLGWEMPNRAQRLSLAGLDREGVRDVLSQMGNPLDALATKIDLISKLYELSAGDPLLVRLYVEALLPQGAQAATLTPEDLAKLQPGLEAYFKRWFEEQQKLWGAAKPLHDKTVRGLLNLCAAALGPLKKDDVLALAPDIFEDSGLLDEAAAAVNRFIIGDGFASGYVFSHPRLGEYFAAKLTDRERQAWQARFLQYGRDTLTALENNTLLPKNAPAYVVQYYAAHLVQTKASATDFYALVCESWLRAWEWLEGTPAGFLNDADHAWQKAEAEGPAALGQQIRAALCFASVISLSANISSDLLVACVKAEVISPALGLVLARQKLDPMERAECLAAIAEFHPSESHAILSEALSAARTISDERDRAEVLATLTCRLPESQLGEVLSVACAIYDDRFRVRVLGALAPRLPESLFGEALTISNEWSRAEDLAVLAPHLPESFFGEALSAARTISDDRYRAKALGALAQRLPEHQQASVLGEALSAARAISDEQYRACVLGEIAPRLSEHEQASVLGEALSAARAISNQEYRADVLRALAPHLPESLLKEALSAARAIWSAWDRAGALGALAPRLPEHEQTEVFREVVSAVHASSLDRSRATDFEPSKSRAEVWGELAPHLPESLLWEMLSVARVIRDDRYRAEALVEIAPRLPEHQQAEVLGEALLTARAISDEWGRYKVLVTLTPRLPESLIEDALSAARLISGEKVRAEVLRELARRLPESLLGEALSAAHAISYEYRIKVLETLARRLPKSLLVEALSTARAISDEQYRARVLGEIASRLPEREQTSVFGEALSAARDISDEKYRADVLRALAPHLPEHEQAEVFREALSAARAISDKSSRAFVLGALAPRLPEHQQAEVLAEALSAARAISDGRRGAQALGALAPLLPESLLGKALSAARLIPHENAGAEVLEALAPRLPENLFGEALSAARKIGDVSNRARVLGALAPRLPQRQLVKELGKVLSEARVIPLEGAQLARAEALGAVAPLLPEREQASVLGEALSAARAISDERSRARVLGKLASRLPEHAQAEVFREVLSTARLIPFEKERAEFLMEIAPRLPEQEQTEVLQEAWSAISYVKAGADVLGEIVHRLPESLLGEALQMARTLCHQGESIAVLSSLATRWSAVCRSTQRTELEELSATLRAFARTKRPQLLQAIQALLPVIVEQGGIPALRETARAIVDTAKWWP